MEVIQTLIPVAVAMQVCWNAQVHCYFLRANCSYRGFSPRDLLFFSSATDLRRKLREFLPARNCSYSYYTRSFVDKVWFLCFEEKLQCHSSHEIIPSVYAWWWCSCSSKAVQFQQAVRSVTQAMGSCSPLMSVRCVPFLWTLYCHPPQGLRIHNMVLIKKKKIVHICALFQNMQCCTLKCKNKMQCKYHTLPIFIT